jgi:hypothetical protein
MHGTRGMTVFVAGLAILLSFEPASGQEPVKPESAGVKPTAPAPSKPVMKAPMGDCSSCYAEYWSSEDPTRRIRICGTLQGPKGSPPEFLAFTRKCRRPNQCECFGIVQQSSSCDPPCQCQRPDKLPQLPREKHGSETRREESLPARESQVTVKVGPGGTLLYQEGTGESSQERTLDGPVETILKDPSVLSTFEVRCRAAEPPPKPEPR